MSIESLEKVKQERREITAEIRTKALEATIKAKKKKLEESGEMKAKKVFSKKRRKKGKSKKIKVSKEFIAFVEKCNNGGI